MFDTLDKFLTKMQEADHKFTVFPHNLSQYRSLTSLPLALDDPELLPTEVDDWLVYFPQAKPQFQGGNVYMTVLIGTSMPLGRIMKAQSNWFKETRFGLWEVNIQTEAPILVGWLLFSTNNINTEILKCKISKFLEDIPVGLHWKMISLGTQGKIEGESGSSPTCLCGQDGCQCSQTLPLSSLCGKCRHCITHLHETSSRNRLGAQYTRPKKDR